MNQKAKEIISRVFRVFYSTGRLVDSKYGMRPMIRHIKENHNNHGLIGCEIGVRKGTNAENILTILDMRKLYLVDPYETYTEMQSNGKTVEDSPHIFLENAKKKLKRFGDKKIFIFKRSEDAITDIPDNLDFCYIDGCHDYVVVKSDIELYYPKVKNGGVLGGHDFSVAFPFLCQAVVEFAKKNDLVIYGSKRDWWVIKEKSN